MLVLEIKKGQSVVIGGFLKVIVTEITENNEVKFGLWPTEYTPAKKDKTAKETEVLATNQGNKDET